MTYNAKQGLHAVVAKQSRVLPNDVENKCLNK